MQKMAEKIYKTVNGQKVELNARQVKNFIMKVNHWTSEEYNKQRYIIKNKLRTYEAFTDTKTTQSPVNFLYFEAKAKQRQGDNYKPSLKAQRIREFTAIGSNKAIQKAMKSQKNRSNIENIYKSYTEQQFAGLIKNNPQAKYIYDTIKDPFKREQALTDFANKLNLKIDETQKVAEAQAIPFGETIGSSDEIDFDLSSYE